MYGGQHIPRKGREEPFQSARRITQLTQTRRISIFHGRPLSIAPGDVEADLPVHRDDLGFSTTASHLTLIQVTLELHQTLAKMSAEM